MKEGNAYWMFDISDLLRQSNSKQNFNFDLSERGMLLVYKCLYQKCHMFKSNVFD